MPRENHHETTPPPVRALLVAVHPSKTPEQDVETSLKELRQLLAGLGVLTLGCLVQRRSAPLGVHVLGEGKSQELQELLTTASEAPGEILLVFDGELTPGQQRHLTRRFGIDVLDRTQVILRIFSQRARTRLAKLEIERAMLQYQAPRIRDDETVLGRQAGGGGRAAKGHTSVELRKEQVRRRLAELDRELTATTRASASRRRQREGTGQVALVGYTNAGKSSWMRALTGAEVHVKDALFATLDTTVRALHPPTTPRILVADTVGFLRNLPNHLLASFRSTLAEALDADLLVLVVDGSDVAWPQHLETTLSVLEEVGAQEIPRRIIVNKADLISEDIRQTLTQSLQDPLLVSAQDSADRGRVREVLLAHFHGLLTSEILAIPFRMEALRSEVLSAAHLVSESYDEHGSTLEVLATASLITKWKRQLEDPEYIESVRVAEPD